MVATAKIVGLDGRPLRSASAFEGASRGPRLRNWGESSQGPNREIAAAGELIKNRTRESYRNSLLMRSAINKNTTSEVGVGFTLLSQCADVEFREKANAVWKVGSAKLDPWGDLNFGALLHLMVKARRMSGEVFGVRVRRAASSSSRAFTQIDVLESDMCPLSLTKQLKNNRRIFQGVEFKGRQKVAFWFYKENPFDGHHKASLRRLVRIPARDVIHHYMPTRPGQVRGNPETAAALVKNKTFHEYDDAELVRKKERAAYTGFLYREDESYLEDDFEFDPKTGHSLHGDDTGYERTESVAAGTILRGVPGEKLELFKGDDAGQGYKDFQRQQTLMLAAGSDIPHPLLTGDWLGLNDRLVRAILNEYRRGIGFDQTNLSGAQVVLGVWRWVMEDAILTGQLHAPGFAENPDEWLKADVRPDAWRYQHPEQDINARNKAVANNISNAERESADYGQDLQTNMDINAKAIADWEKACARHGVKNVPLSGIFSPPETQQEDVK